MIQQFEDGSEHVKVVDFGLVKLTDTDQTLTRAGLILGSPHCMSPEQVKGEEVDARSDIYAVGVLLFRAVTGRYPFHGPNSAATMMAHLNKEVPSFYSIDPDMQVPEGMEEVVRKCLGKEPDDRFASMNELIGALSALIDLPPDLYRTATVSAATMHDVAVAASLEASIAQERERDRQVFARTLLMAVALAAIGIGMGWALVTRTVQDRAPQTQRDVPSETLVDAPAEPVLVQPDGPVPADVATDDDAPPDNPDTPSGHDEAPQEPPPAASDADETPEVTPAPTATPRPVAKPRPTPRPKPKPTPAPVETPAAAPPATTEPARPASNDEGEKPDDASAPSPDGYKGLPDDW
jgi:serine/threonine-protein kinase